eukprot:COSAG03_NODE_521_length_7208_cov_11.258264_2_plen_120_part_00
MDIRSSLLAYLSNILFELRKICGVVKSSFISLFEFGFKARAFLRPSRCARARVLVDLPAQPRAAPSRPRARAATRQARGPPGAIHAHCNEHSLNRWNNPQQLHMRASPPIAPDTRGPMH